MGPEFYRSPLLFAVGLFLFIIVSLVIAYFYPPTRNEKFGIQLLVLFVSALALVGIFNEDRKDILQGYINLEQVRLETQFSNFVGRIDFYSQYTCQFANKTPIPLGAEDVVAGFAAACKWFWEIGTSIPRSFADGIRHLQETRPFDSAVFGNEVMRNEVMSLQQSALELQSKHKNFSDLQNDVTEKPYEMILGFFWPYLVGIVIVLQGMKFMAEHRGYKRCPKRKFE